MKLGDWLSLWKSMPPVVEVPVTVIGRSGRRVAPRRAADAELVRGRPAATLLVEKGLFRGGQHGDVKGTDAIHQLLERPFPGTFAFVTRTDVGKQWHLGPERDMTSLILEGVRRYDEFNRAGLRLHRRAVGADLAPQKRIVECETAMCVDSYRVRRILAHWIEEGALQPASRRSGRASSGRFFMSDAAVHRASPRLRAVRQPVRS